MSGHKVTPEQLCKVIRQSFIGAEQVYLNGSCIMFHRILRNVFPLARPYWSKEAKHCITEIDGQFFDITGQVEKTEDYELDNVQKWNTLKIATAFPSKINQVFRNTTPKTLAEF